MDQSWLYELKKPPPFVLRLPLLGVICFLILYVLAALSYPGGSATEPTFVGFDFWSNYLCDLLDEFAVNGELNSARFHARAALFALCSGLVLLWFYLPLLFVKRSKLHYLVWSTGIVALLILFLMGTHNHDLIVRLSGLFGVTAILTCSMALLRDGFRLLGNLGITCFAVFLLNYFIYETGISITDLPVIQKVTFILCLTWFTGLNYALIRKLENP
ncbi:hypothetical protein SAMN06265375_102139 [Muriicola jejuensis]|nr:hypothetical protein SAMN06265375_102139 [Muriicola jejuensis]